MWKQFQQCNSRSDLLEFYFTSSALISSHYFYFKILSYQIISFSVCIDFTSTLVCYPVTSLEIACCKVLLWKNLEIGKDFHFGVHVESFKHETMQIRTMTFHHIAKVFRLKTSKVVGKFHMIIFIWKRMLWNIYEYVFLWICRFCPLLGWILAMTTENLKTSRNKEFC